MTAPASIKYEDWVAVIDDANKAQERVKKLEKVISDIQDSLISYEPEYASDHVRTIEMIIERASEE